MARWFACTDSLDRLLKDEIMDNDTLNACYSLDPEDTPYGLDAEYWLRYIDTNWRECVCFDPRRHSEHLNAIDTVWAGAQVHDTD